MITELGVKPKSHASVLQTGHAKEPDGSIKKDSYRTLVHLCFSLLSHPICSLKVLKKTSINQSSYFRLCLCQLSVVSLPPWTVASAFCPSKWSSLPQQGKSLTQSYVELSGGIFSHQPGPPLRPFTWNRNKKSQHRLGYSILQFMF